MLLFVILYATSLVAMYGAEKHIACYITLFLQLKIKLTMLFFAIRLQTGIWTSKHKLPQ